ncbi:cAMP-regulated phosphoprotein 21-like [Durio zibethinus]|uniref:cAMP-regulated phosphoprotein 21-like n=1 Tax=Durio zibethinus TaxID=66656 RepID=A0A6P5YP92_DURZI|nr:cAMP-regulated phosphoprotein 21-like [Durio zibethinus]
MDLTSTTTTSATAAVVNDKESVVDPFLVEALQNPRHRLTILRMELDIQRFLQNSDQKQFEFQHFPTSYLRLAAHRVAQHYGLITMVHDNGLDGLGSRIVVKKVGEIRWPAVRLSEIPDKHSENDKTEQIKIAIRPRPHNGSVNEANQTGIKRSPMRSVEERKEEYDRARARIFSSPNSPDSDDSSPQISIDGKNESLIRDESENYRSLMVELEKNITIRDGTSRVAIFRDREKDRTDPDYDRSYQRYVRSIPSNQSFGLAPYNMQKIQLPFMQYDSAFPQLGQIASTQASLCYGVPARPALGPFCDLGLNPTSSNGAYMQWPSATMMYSHSHDQFRNDVFQAPFCHQPLSFDYTQNG